MTPFSPPPSLWSLQTPTLPGSVGLNSPASNSVGGKGAAFQQVWAGVQSGHQTVEVESGDTLIGLVKAHFRQNQVSITETQATQLAHQVARHNQLDNPDLILPGQKIDFAPLQLPALNRQASNGPLDIQTPNAVQAFQQLRASGLTADALALRGARMPEVPTHNTSGVHTVLEKTLGRAVEKGFVAARDLDAVRQKVMGLARRYNFAPDDFARLTLMESGGMNPQASNGSCHGIIQFCDGANRGAAAVGLKNNPRSILGMGLLQQLDLVDRYFSQAGLAAQGQKLGLDDLYLSVLTPAARQETRPDAPLPIAGPQARHLHVGGDTRQPITRNSILAGLHSMTDTLLGLAQGKNNGSRKYAEMAQTTPPALR